jgi:hypothetical protein
MAPKDEDRPASISDDNAQTQTRGPAVVDPIDLDKLGRQRPDVFSNAVYELLFCSSLLVSFFMAVRHPYELTITLSKNAH